MLVVADLLICVVRQAAMMDPEELSDDRALMRMKKMIVSGRDHKNRPEFA